MVLVIWDAIICDGLECILPITVALLEVLEPTLLSLQFEDVIRFFRAMRAGEMGCNFASIGRLVIEGGEDIGFPEHVVAELRSPLALGTDDASPQRGDFSPPPRSGAGHEQGSSGSDQSSSVFEEYFRRFNDLNSEVLSWWDDARDNMQKLTIGASLADQGSEDQPSRRDVRFRQEAT